MKKISIDHILLLHNILVKYTGGADGVRDIGLLESAINSPFATFSEVALYPTIQNKAVKLCIGLIKNHPFIDGNKRIGVLAMLSFLEINGIRLNCTDDELINIGLGVADSTINQTDLLNFVIEHSN